MSCKINNCPSNYRKTSIFRFPKTPHMRRRWIKAIESYQTFDHYAKEYHVCMHHFLTTDVVCVGNRTNLRPDAVPCIFEPFKDIGAMESTKRASVDQLEGQTKRIKIEKSASNDGLDALTKPCEMRLLDIRNNSDDLGILMNSNENNSNDRSQICHKCIRLEQKLKSAYKQIDWMQTKINELTAEINTLKPSDLCEMNATIQTVDEITKCKLCNVCIKKTEIEHHVCIDGKSMSCKYCLETFTSTDSFLKHLLDADHRTWINRDREAKKFFKCGTCKLAYTMRILLKCHRKSHEQPIPEMIPSVPVENSCDNIRSSTEKLVTNLQLTDYKLTVCDMDFDSTTSLSNHRHVVDDEAKTMEPTVEESDQSNKEQPNTEQSIMESVCQIDIVTKKENGSSEKKEQSVPAQEMSTCKLCNRAVVLAQHLCDISQKSLLCKYCNSRYTTTESFLKHLSKSDHVAKIKQDRINKIFFRCKQCRKCYPMKVLLQCHEISHQLESTETGNSLQVEKQNVADNGVVSNVVPSGESGSVYKRLFKCGKCAASFNEAQELSAHIREEHSEKRVYECYVCKIQILQHETAMRNHLRTHFVPNGMVCRLCKDYYDKTESHLCGKQDTIQCDYCDQIFTTTAQLSTHLDNDHEQKKLYQCNKCLKYHPMLFLKKHHHCNAQVEKPFACNICSKKFASHFKLKNHEKFHNSNAHYLCDECGKTFQSATNFKNHQMSSIHNEPTFHCTECPNKYYNESKLKRHLEKHRGLTYVCEICKREFKSKQSHKQHMAIHNRTEADRQFECQICPKKFFTTKNLRQHYTVHYGENSFKCRFCEAAYKYKGDLNKHLRSHLDGKIHECDKCPLSFYYPEELQTHLSEHFKEETNQLNNQATV